MTYVFWFFWHCPTILLVKEFEEKKCSRRIYGISRVSTICEVVTSGTSRCQGALLIPLLESWIPLFHTWCCKNFHDYIKIKNSAVLFFSRQSDILLSLLDFWNPIQMNALPALSPRTPVLERVANGSSEATGGQAIAPRGQPGSNVSLA